MTFHVMDGAAFLASGPASFDLIYADAWPGKFSHLDDALALLRLAWASGVMLVVRRAE